MRKERRKVNLFSINVRSVITVVLVAFIVVFLFSNSDRLARPLLIELLGTEFSFAVGVWLFICYLLGVCSWMLIAFKALLNRRKIIKTKDKEIKELMNELAQYRNQALEDEEEEEVVLTSTEEG
ncbi:MAG: hypothetical protein OCD01_01190 [Fibrobacterales bacterium]